MDEYPAGSLDQSIPLLLTLGVSASSAPHGTELSAALKEQAVLIRSDLDPLDTEDALALLRYIQERDASQLPCNGRDTTRRYRFRVRTAERSLLLPPRRARLPEGVEAPPTPAVLHSPFSPLSPISPLYPDGFIDTQWLRKHQDIIPSVLLCFYTLVSDPGLATLCDNQIKTDVNNIRALLSQSGYKSRLAVVFLSDRGAHSIDGVQERLETIRKGCGLDPKALFFVPPNESPDELERIGENMLATLYGVAIEYYRDLGRHARKKRGRGVAPQPTIPPTSGTSQILSLVGWNVRYDFKSAIFAEYRLEMDTALRSFEQAYEGLLSSELLELIPSWSPRWNDARFLADVIAVRCLRCLVWNAQYSAAARRWQFHRDRVADFVERRGRGTSNYGWKAWEARWATVMANLIEKADLSEFSPSSSKVYLQPEKSVMGERLQPWEFLHHTGYWYRIAAKHLSGRRAFAHAMPEADRRPPSFSPASQVASKAFTYDTYMCPDPHEEYPLDREGVDHSHMIVESLMRARTEFLKRHQVRFAAELSLECAGELAVSKDWQSIVELLRPLWKDMTFRAEGWLTIAEDLSWMLRAAAARTGKAELVIAIDWELMNRSFTKRKNWHYDISRTLDGISPKSKPHVHIEDGQTLSFVSASFLFRNDEGKAGQSTNGQLAITSNAHHGSSPIALSNIQVDFTGSLSHVILRHEENIDAKTQQKRGSVVLSRASLETVVEKQNTEDKPSDLEEDLSKSVTLQGASDLTLAPGQTAVFDVQIPLREPGETSAVSLTLNYQSDTFGLDQYLSFQRTGGSNLWYLSAASTTRISRDNPVSIRVLPRPPQMEIVGLTWREQYYTDEPIALELEIINEEEVDAPAKLDVTLLGEDVPVFTIEALGQGDEASSSVAGSDESRISGVSLGSIESSKSLSVYVRVPSIKRSSRFDLTLKVVYFLSTDPGTPITQTSIFQLNVVNPFEANYDLLPRIHPDPWPSLFDPEGVRDLSEVDNTANLIPRGLSQTWCLVTRYASFASEDLRVTDVDIRALTSQTVTCTSTRKVPALEKAPDGGRIVKPKTIEDAAFDIVAQKSTLDDRSPATLDVSFVIRWTRLNPSSPSAPPNITTLPVPRFTLFGIEPRVLASVSHLRLKEAEPPGGSKSLGRRRRNRLLVVLRVVIENASNHFLTFGLTMEPSDEFAFSGPKQTTLHLLPVSRRAVTYRLLPLREAGDEGGNKSVGSWIRPGLVVRDKYFQKLLRVIPTEGMKLDKEGAVLVWVPPEEEVEEVEEEGAQEEETTEEESDDGDDDEDDKDDEDE
ncbi:Gryzun, putative trafficking through golgi-domain-containing protein [Lasiosphaeria hispida]|uniref:Gryzun, putative trafficking through golgi-domain-containing protein n=1 Tax=Lasiosphaeria hispida TaxID=260671 RepID=A0AAJ0MCU3_9PEZI|nr:Gryzun, putative trafficking through golgi-domain-containing protein [Lasiosphaeria hispida]